MVLGDQNQSSKNHADLHFHRGTRTKVPLCPGAGQVSPPPSPPSKPGTGELLHTRKLRLRSVNASPVCPASVSGVRIQTQSRLFPNLHCNSVLRSLSLGLFPTPASTIVLSTLGDFNPEEQNQPPPRVATLGKGTAQSSPLPRTNTSQTAACLASFRETQRGAEISYCDTASLSRL